MRKTKVFTVILSFISFYSSLAFSEDSYEFIQQDSSKSPVCCKAVLSTPKKRMSILRSLSFNSTKSDQDKNLTCGQPVSNCLDHDVNLKKLNLDFTRLDELKLITKKHSLSLNVSVLSAEDITHLCLKLLDENIASIASACEEHVYKLNPQESKSSQSECSTPIGTFPPLLETASLGLTNDLPKISKSPGFLSKLKELLNAQIKAGAVRLGRGSGKTVYLENKSINKDEINAFYIVDPLDYSSESQLRAHDYDRIKYSISIPGRLEKLGVTGITHTTQVLIEKDDKIRSISKDSQIPPDEKVTIAHYMKYYKNGSLSNFLKKDQKLTGKQVLSIAKQTCTALYQMHRVKFIHKDIKLDNILIGDIDTDYVEAVLGDYDQSFFLDEKLPFEFKANLTTPLYNSPEFEKYILNSNEMRFDVFKQRDYYSLGLTLAETIGYPEKLPWRLAKERIRLTQERISSYLGSIFEKVENLSLSDREKEGLKNLLNYLLKTENDPNKAENGTKYMTVDSKEFEKLCDAIPNPRKN